ncbi:FAD-dependent oxidoreductase [Nocardia sp. NPDC050378]|uniref:FAD-dependent oxidoreductase n=1 Tax=Nocardia sp. NPDC050378 TaxID=3155400 RepID=UPI0033EFECBF
MAHVITQNCCNDANCVAVCPADCIHPRPDEPGFATAEMLYIDAESCIDCGACIPACPVDAIFPDFDDQLPSGFNLLEELNARYYRAAPPATPAPMPKLTLKTSSVSAAAPELPQLRVAIVGSGPAAHYAAAELLDSGDAAVSVDMFERLPLPGGLIRYGVAPDHERTKGVQTAFVRMRRRPEFRMFLNVEVGRDITVEQLSQRYHAVIYAVGASSDRQLGIPGEDLPGSHSATDFVAWYNGHPDYTDRSFDLSGTRAVVVGNGNVALDVARVLAGDPDRLAGTDIADHALAALRTSNIREVVVVGRRGPADAAFTTPELIGLTLREDLDLVVAPEAIEAHRGAFPAGAPPLSEYKVEVLGGLADRARGRDRRIVLRFLSSPTEIAGEDRVTGIRLGHNRLVSEAEGRTRVEPAGTSELLDCGLVLRAIGYRGSPIADLPYDAERGIIPNDNGRVTDPISGLPVPGVYTTGWIKRGPSGGIGMNKQCAADTVGRLLADLAAGALPEPVQAPTDLAELLPDHVDIAGARAIEDHETAQGAQQMRPRVKVVEIDRMLELARKGI